MGVDFWIIDCREYWRRELMGEIDVMIFLDISGGAWDMLAEYFTHE